MSFLKALTNSIARTFGRIIAYALIGIAIYFIGHHFVNAESIRLRAFNLTDSEFINSTSSSASGNDYMYRALVNIGDGTITTGNTAYFSFDITYGIRTDTLTTNVVQNLYALYWFDTSSNVYNITDSCNVSATKKFTDEGTSQLWQWRVTGTCQVTPSANLSGFLFDTRYTYSGGNPLYGSRKSAIQISDFKITNTPSEGQQIIDNANQNTADIISSASQNTADIIQNQTEQSGLIIDALENQNKVCNNDIKYTYSYNNAEIQGKYLNSSGQEINANNNWISPYLRADSTETTIINVSDSLNANSFCFYDKDKTKISCESYANRREITLTNPSNTYYIRTGGGPNSLIIITTTYCYDYREKETEQMEDISSDIKSFLTIFSDDTSVSDSSINTALNGIQLADDTPMTNILMFPVLIFSYFNNNMSNSCSSVSLGSLYGHEITLPCIDIQGLIGSTLYNIIDLFMLFYMLYNFCHFLIGFFESSSELNNPFEHFFVKGADTNG